MLNKEDAFLLGSSLDWFMALIVLITVTLSAACIILFTLGLMVFVYVASPPDWTPATCRTYCEEGKMVPESPFNGAYCHCVSDTCAER